MSLPSFAVRDDPALGPGGRRFLLDCAHGSTSAVLLPGRKPLNNLVVLDLLMARHNREKGCSCSRDLRPTMAAVGRA